jgi:hypothetical protein
LLPNEPHTEFLELCAVSTSGQLSEAEQKRLEAHLAGCPSCRQALGEYEAVIDRAIPAIAAEEGDDTSPGPGWSQRRAEKAFLRRLAEQDDLASAEPRATSSRTPDRSRIPPYSNGPTWPQVWMLYAAGILLFVSLGFYAYRVHFRSHTGPGEPVHQQGAVELPPSTASSLEEQLSDAGHERALAQAQIQERDKLIGDLRRQLAEESANIAQLKNAQERLENEVRRSETGREELAHKQSELGLKLTASENNSRSLQERVNTLAEQSARDAERTRALQVKNDDLTGLLKDREAELERQDQLLAHDKDIRDLMGARDLYIAEVYDITRTGETKKAYGRVFYTRGKSLIFYAYDLDQEMEAKDANSFQAWGRRGPDRQQAVNLGIFYEDNVARKRWILKCEDSKALAQIDGVFVTIEPNGGSHKPSGKSLLFAYLKLSPNHP